MSEEKERPEPPVRPDEQQIKAGTKAVLNCVRSDEHKGFWVEIARPDRRESVFVFDHEMTKLMEWVGLRLNPPVPAA